MTLSVPLREASARALPSFGPARPHERLGFALNAAGSRVILLLVLWAVARSSTIDFATVTAMFVAAAASGFARGRVHRSASALYATANTLRCESLDGAAREVRWIDVRCIHHQRALDGVEQIAISFVTPAGVDEARCVASTLESESFVTYCMARRPADRESAVAACLNDAPIRARHMMHFPRDCAVALLAAWIGGGGIAMLTLAAAAVVLSGLTEAVTAHPLRPART